MLPTSLLHEITNELSQLCSLVSQTVRLQHNLFQIISTETLSVPLDHTRISPAHIPNWKRPPRQVCALLESEDKFEPNIEMSAPNVFFVFP